MRRYSPKKKDIKKLFEGDESYFDKAAEIVERWYEEEEMESGEDCWTSRAEFLEDGYFDISELVEGRNLLTTKQDAIECHIVWMALDGEDPYEDENDCCDDDESEDSEDD